jgi:carnosine N-methyltransferase
MEKRITAIAELLESDGFVLEELLKPIQFTLGITEQEHPSYLFTKDHSKSDVSSYDSAMHIITHITRDWSYLGLAIRTSLYDWCIEKLSTYRNQGDRILIPGAGLGRLTWDVFRNGYNVEGNEISIVMATAAFHVLHGNVSGKVHPFAMDYLMNEVMSSDRYQSVEFPDIDIQMIDNGLSLSYTIGDFVEIYSETSYKNQYDSIVTCFFIDTASNIYEYIITIRNALKNGGVWVNVGPLQWHMNAKLHPSGDELKSIVQRMGFDIQEWSVDDEAINYRYDDKEERTRHTKYEGYKPLRFVAICNGVDSTYQTDFDAKQMILNIRHSITASPKKWNNEDSPSYNHDTISLVTITELS